METLLFLGLGLLVGVIARWVVPGQRRGSSVAPLGLGVLGGLAGGFFGRAVGLHEVGPTAGLASSVVGAVVLLLAYAKFAPWNPRQLK